MSRGPKSKPLANRFAIETLESRTLLSGSGSSALASAALAAVPGVIQPHAVTPHVVSATSETTLTPVTVTNFTADKPQSKAWVQAGFHWSVMSDSTGTWVYRLDGTTWTQVLKLTTDTLVRADVRNAGNVTHILMFNQDFQTCALASVELVAGGTPTQQFWTTRPTVITVPLANNVNTVTMDIDINGRMWIAYDGTSFINVRYSDGNYSTWSNAIQLGGGITSDDIAAISRVGNYGIGVMWSNQTDQRFHFRFHSYLQGATVWGEDEYPGAGQALALGRGLADGHIHLADDVSGNLYAAVKTGYDTPGNTEIGLLVRRANGSWDDLYEVAQTGTRPTIAVDQQRDTLVVAYTNNSLVPATVVYKKSSLGTISFSSATTLMAGPHWNVTTTKQRQNNGSLVFLADNGTGTVVDSTQIDLAASPTSPTVPPPPQNGVPQLKQQALNSTPITTDTGAQGQSKSWFQASRWWTVLADSSGTWVYRLDGTTWTKALQISASTTATADTRASGNLTHILLTDGTATAKLLTVQLVNAATPTYQAWTTQPSAVDIALTANTRQATLELDDQGVLWVAYDGESNLFVKYLLPNDNYTTVSSPITLASGVTNDDIITISRVGNDKVGVMWSNQNLDRFGFRVHNAVDAPTVWGADELPGQVANLPIGDGIADSQIHMATLADGRLYAVVKTNFDDGIGGQPEIGLLIRYANGVWDPNLFAVDDVGDNAQVVISPSANRLVVAYTNASSSKTNNIVYKTTSLSAINFAGKGTILPGGWDLVSTTKQKVTGAFPLIGSNGTPDTAAGVLLTIV